MARRVSLCPVDGISRYLRAKRRGLPAQFSWPGVGPPAGSVVHFSSQQPAGQPGSRRAGWWRSTPGAGSTQCADDDRLAGDSGFRVVTDRNRPTPGAAPDRGDDRLTSRSTRGDRRRRATTPSLVPAEESEGEVARCRRRASAPRPPGMHRIDRCLGIRGRFCRSTRAPAIVSQLHRIPR
jgi:hypothetical protein